MNYFSHSEHGFGARGRRVWRACAVRRGGWYAGIFGEIHAGYIRRSIFVSAESFDDGSFIDWFSKESLVYREGDYMVQIVYDYSRLGVFKTGRVLFPSLVTRWEEFPKDASPEISGECRDAIIQKAKYYFERRRIPVEIRDV